MEIRAMLNGTIPGSPIVGLKFYMPDGQKVNIEGQAYLGNKRYKNFFVLHFRRPYVKSEGQESFLLGSDSISVTLLKRLNSAEKIEPYLENGMRLNFSYSIKVFSEVSLKDSGPCLNWNSRQARF